MSQSYIKSNRIGRVKQKHDTTENWNNENALTLLEGEIGLDTSTGQIKIGDGESDWKNLSYLTSSNANSYQENCFSFGENAVAGQKAFYIQSINTAEKIIALCAQKPDNIPMGDDVELLDNYEVILELYNLEFGDKLSIINNAYYYFCVEVEDFSGNLIQYKGDLPFNSITYNTDLDDHVVFISGKPEIGIVNIIDNAISIGLDTKAGGKGSFACGRQTIAAGGGSFAAGRRTKAGYIATATGLDTSATGNFSFAANNYTLASGECSAAFGNSTQALGNASFSCGNLNEAIGPRSFSAGKGTKTLGEASTAFGVNGIATGHYSFVANNQNNAVGESSTAFGLGTRSEGLGSFACGSGTKATGQYSFSSGQGSQANGVISNSLGCNTQANGPYSLATNNNTIASGESSVALGYYTQALGNYSMATGLGTIVEDESMYVGGKYNNTTTNKIIVYGNGNSWDTRHDAYALDWNGNGWYSGNLNCEGQFNSKSIKEIEGYSSTFDSLTNPGYYHLKTRLTSTSTDFVLWFVIVSSKLNTDGSTTIYQTREAYAFDNNVEQYQKQYRKGNKASGSNKVEWESDWKDIASPTKFYKSITLESTSSKTFSYETQYPASKFDIEVSLDLDACKTLLQGSTEPVDYLLYYEAYAEAQIQGFRNVNDFMILGELPTLTNGLPLQLIITPKNYTLQEIE